MGSLANRCNMIMSNHSCAGSLAELSVTCHNQFLLTDATVSQLEVILDDPCHIFKPVAYPDSML